MNCTATRTTDCIPASTGLDGDLLQIMPWPSLSKDDGPMVTRRWVRPAIVVEVSFVEWTRESPSTVFQFKAADRQHAHEPQASAPRSDAARTMGARPSSAWRVEAIRWVLRG
jgi:hypothetical protein